MQMSADKQMPAEAALRQVRVDCAARRLYQLKTALDAHSDPQAPGAMATRRRRQAEHRAHRALTRAGFANPATATAVLGQVQVLTMTVTLARLDYHTPDAAQAAVANLIASPPATKPQPDCATRTERLTPRNGTADKHAARVRTSANDQATSIHDADARDVQLVAAATRIVAAATQDGSRLSQAALADRLRRDGYTVANNRLHWLSAVSGLGPRPSADRDRQPRGGR
jgi:hypothetical protein